MILSCGRPEAKRHLVRRSNFGIFGAILTYTKVANMAEAEHQKGEMDISEQQEAYDIFANIIKWGTIGAAVCAVLAAIFAQMWWDQLPTP